MARSEGAQDSQQHIAPAAAATRARAQQSREHLAIHASELAVEPHLQILRRHRRSLLLRLEHAHRSALENHVHRPTAIGRPSVTHCEGWYNTTQRFAFRPRILTGLAIRK